MTGPRTRSRGILVVAAYDPAGKLRAACGKPLIQLEEAAGDAGTRYMQSVRWEAAA